LSLILFLGWYAHHGMAGNPLALQHDLRRLQPQHIYGMSNALVFESPQLFMLKITSGLESNINKLSVFAFSAFVNRLFNELEFKHNPYIL